MSHFDRLAEVLRTTLDQADAQRPEWTARGVDEDQITLGCPLCVEPGQLGVGIELQHLRVNTILHLLDEVERRGCAGEELRVDLPEAAEQVPTVSLDQRGGRLVKDSR